MSVVEHLVLSQSTYRYIRPALEALPPFPFFRPFSRRSFASFLFRYTAPVMNISNPPKRVLGERFAMPKTVALIGLQPDELPWLRMLVDLLRHPDPTVPELAHQALLYLSRSAAASTLPMALPKKSC
jgi:hypothetical protein